MRLEREFPQSRQDQAKAHRVRPSPITLIFGKPATRSCWAIISLLAISNSSAKSSRDSGGLGERLNRHGGLMFSEPGCDSVSASLIQQEMQLSAAEQEVLGGHRVLSLHGMDQLGECNAGGDLLSELGVLRDPVVEALNLVAIG